MHTDMTAYADRNNSAPYGDQSSVQFAAGQPAAAVDAMNVQWAAVQNAAGAVAMLAGLAPDAVESEMHGFPESLRDQPEWKIALAGRGVSDLAAILQSGVKALLAVNAQGRDAAVPAMALWREYDTARSAIVSLAKG